MIDIKKLSPKEKRTLYEQLNFEYVFQDVLELLKDSKETQTHKEAIANAVAKRYAFNYEENDSNSSYWDNLNSLIKTVRESV